jgi:aryl-alcohol dehydrogenase-like predicted oxidoreductase
MNKRKLGKSNLEVSALGLVTVLGTPSTWSD